MIRKQPVKPQGPKEVGKNFFLGGGSLKLTLPCPVTIKQCTTAPLWGLGHGWHETHIGGPADPLRAPRSGFPSGVSDFMPPTPPGKSCKCTHRRTQVSAGVGKPGMDSECASGCTWSTAWAAARLRDSRARSTGVIQGQRGGKIEVRNFSQFSAISQFFAIFRNFSQFSAIFRNFSAIFLSSRFSDCLPTLVQNNEIFFFYYAMHSLMFQVYQMLAYLSW